MSGWDITGWVGAAVVQKFVDVAEKLLHMGVKRLLPVDSEAALKRVQVDSEAALKRIQEALPQIRAVMGVAEALKMEDPSSRQWVHRFREAVDAAEDVIDELEYKKLEDEVQNRSDHQVAGSSSSSKKRKTTGAISGDILERLKKAVTMLDEATAGVEDLRQRAESLGIRYITESQFKVCPNLRRETTSFLAERKVFGREDEKAKIIGWLKRETEAPLSSVGIVGVGGLGKTTLAQSVHQELSGSSYFQKIIWVCVSTEFSVKGITKNILAEMEVEYHGDNPLNKLQQRLKEKIHVSTEFSVEGITKNIPVEMGVEYHGEGITKNILGVEYHGDNPLNKLQQRLKEKIHSSNKVLLILDDVWEDGKRGDWEQLVAPLRFAQQGSKILFTTRQKSVANLLASIINTEHESLPLENLEEKELRMLFKSYAFRGSNPKQHGDLQAIGDQIVTKLHGNPLAAKVIGSLLNSRMDSLYWRAISNNDSLINLEQANGVMDVLKLSYYNLPADLQVCFRFCSIFPRDYKFDKEDLIKMWMACGFIRKQSCEGRRPEDIGEDYFNLLLRKSFFELYKGPWREEIYFMHDLIHELAQNVSNGECCRVASGDKSVIIPSTVRHVSVHECEIQKVFHLKNIRSLVITTRKQQNGFIRTFVLPNNLVQKSLRLLKINALCNCKLPEEMSCLVHLRYLSIELNYGSQSFKYLLPASIYKLHHLLCLEFKEGYPDSGYSLGTETTGMANLVSLRYMRLPNKIMKTICGVHRMTSLQELTFFVRKESGYRINELRTLNNLRRLTIHNIENIGDPAEATSANLLAKKNLESLSLICTLRSNLENLEQIFDNLQPHQNLMELVIENYNGQRSPVWIRDMSYLKILHIFKCPNLVQLLDMPLSLTEFRVVSVGLTSLPNFGVNTPTPLSQKSSLRKVKIMNCPNLISLNGFFEQGNLELQGLEKLIIKDCEKLTQLPMHALRRIVSLKHLSIVFCRNLTKLPCLPLSLIKFRIIRIAISALPEYFESPGSSGGPSPSSFTSSLHRVYIGNCPNLIALNGFFQQDNIDFRAINTINVRQCENLVRIPIEVIWKFESLTKLTIMHCPKLLAVDNQNNPLPSKLKELVIKNCGELDVPLLESSSRLTTLTHLTIINCANISRIPSTENVFGSLYSLDIRGCSKLNELSLMQQAHNVNRGSNVASLKIETLSIDQLSLLLIEPLRSLRFVTEMGVSNCSEMDAWSGQWLLQNSSTLRRLKIRNASPLQSLPAIIARLTALEELEIYCHNLQMELPDLPASLEVRRINASSFPDKF